MSSIVHWNESITGGQDGRCRSRPEDGGNWECKADDQACQGIDSLGGWPGFVTLRDLQVPDERSGLSRRESEKEGPLGLAACLLFSVAPAPRRAFHYQIFLASDRLSELSRQPPIFISFSFLFFSSLSQPPPGYKTPSIMLPISIPVQSESRFRPCAPDEQ